MRWFWQPKLETRQESSYTDTLVELLLSRASGQGTAFPAAIGALEAASGLIGRAFASAEVEADSDTVRGALTPDCLALIGRTLTRHGEITFYIDTSMGRIDLLPCQSHNVDGSPNPATWEYLLTVAGPERTHTYPHTPAASVIHCTYAREPQTPWRGIGPLQSAGLTGRLGAELMAALADEASGPRGSILGTPLDGNDPTMAQLKEDIRKLAGKMSFLETGDWGGAAGGGSMVLRPERIGFNPPAGLVDLFKLTREDVLSACGVNPALLMDAQGTAMREAYRQFLFNTVAPLGRMVSAEVSRKLDTVVTFDWAELRASDIAGRARAFGTMVTGGMDLTQAAALSGLLMGEE